MKILKTFLEASESFVPADELGKNWEIFVVIAVVIATLPWIVLIVYTLFFKKYRVRFFLGEECVNTSYYKKNEGVVLYNTETYEWYYDTELTEKVVCLTIEDKNIKLFGKLKDENN